MKHYRRLFSLSVLTLLATTASAMAAYEGWYQSDFWSGEYPNGFSVVKEGVVLSGRAEMDPDAPANVSCAVPYKAVFHTWNAARPAQYRTASQIVPMVAKVDLTLGYEGEKQAQVKAGETIEYLQYGAEGTFMVRYQNEEFTGDQELMEKVSYDTAAMEARKQEEWVRISCQNGGQAWIHFSDLVGVNGDGEETWIDGLASWFKGFRDYGSATDLTDDDLGRTDQGK